MLIASLNIINNHIVECPKCREGHLIVYFNEPLKKENIIEYGGVDYACDFCEYIPKTKIESMELAEIAETSYFDTNSEF